MARSGSKYSGMRSVSRAVRASVRLMPIPPPRPAHGPPRIAARLNSADHGVLHRPCEGGGPADCCPGRGRCRRQGRAPSPPLSTYLPLSLHLSLDTFVIVRTPTPPHLFPPYHFPPFHFPSLLFHHLYPSIITIFHLSLISIISIYHLYLSSLSIISIYHNYLSYLSIISIYHIHLSYIAE